MLDGPIPGKAPRIWVCLEDVQLLFCDLEAVFDSFYATGEPLSVPMAVQQALVRWPEMPDQMYVPEAPKRPAASVIEFPAKEKAV